MSDTSIYTSEQPPYWKARDQAEKQGGTTADHQNRLENEAKAPQLMPGAVKEVAKIRERAAAELSKAEQAELELLNKIGQWEALRGRRNDLSKSLAQAEYELEGLRNIRAGRIPKADNCKIVGACGVYGGNLGIILKTFTELVGAERAIVEIEKVLPAKRALLAEAEAAIAKFAEANGIKTE